MSIAIKVENLSKAYQIGQIGTGTISRDIERWLVTKILRKEDPFLKIGEINDRSVKGQSNIVWSLKEINFEISQGDAVGIIGKNGAGKSTLLKLLSRVTSPTTGKIKLKGRVSSLLEVGTGFHPELTGRENIYLNGSILGMRKKEIDRKLDEIIDFSGVERYVDTPVKRYSSGMYVRLAFAVAANLESEILIVDEVLAVGDADFQKKCLGKMGDITKQGRTVLFVSHNLSAVQDLCTQGLLIDKGQVVFDGDITKCIGQYYEKSIVENYNPQEGGAKKWLEIYNLKINNSTFPTIGRSEEFSFMASISGENIENPTFFFIIENASGQQMVHTMVSGNDIDAKNIEGIYHLTLKSPQLWLSPGVYSVYLKILAQTLGVSKRIDSERLMLRVKGNLDSTGRTLLTPDIKWKIKNESIDLSGDYEVSIAG